MRKYLIGGALAAVVLAGMTTAATATPLPYDGVLGIHGPGSVYAGTDASGLDSGAYVSLSTTAGGTVSFPVEVLNKGTAQAQYQVGMTPDGASAQHLLLGSVDVTGLAEAGYPGGYETAPIAPGKTALLTLKITVPKTATPLNQYTTTLTLWSPGGYIYLGSVRVAVQIRATTGTSSNDIFTGGVRGLDIGGQRPWITAATLKAGSTTLATFSLTLKNDSATSTHMTLLMGTVFDCSAASFVPTVKVGTTVITAAAFSDAGYTTPLMAKGTSKAVVLTVKSVLPHPDFSACANTEAYTADVTTGGNTNGVDLIVNAYVPAT